jgi:outer membrane protein assembly factor BamB
MAQQTAAAPSRAARSHRLYIPIILLTIIVAIFFLPAAWAWADWDETLLQYIEMVGTMVLLLCLALLLVWFFFLSRFSWVARFLGLVFLLLCGVAYPFLVLKVEFDANWHLHPIFVWQGDPAARFRDYRASQGDVSDLPPIDLTIDTEHDFPRFRGFSADGVVKGIRLQPDWTEKPKVIWKHPCGGGYAGFAVAGNVLVTIEQRDENEAVVCYDRASGRERWAYEYEARFHRSEPMGGDGPRATPTIADGAVYSLGATGYFVCLDGETGKPRWGFNILEKTGSKNIEWGMSGSPLIVHDLVIVNPGADSAENAGKALVGYNRADGKESWNGGDHKAGYSSPQISTLCGVPQILLFDASGLAGYDSKDGKELWSYSWETMMGMNTIQPLVIGEDRILISSELENGCALVEVKKDGEEFTATKVWKSKKLGAKFSSLVTSGGAIYGLSNNRLVCLDAATGEQKWRGGNYGHGQLLLVGDVILVSGEAGQIALVAVDPEKFRETAHMQVFSGDAFTGKSWNTPALAGNHLCLRTHTEMACVELPLAK